MSAAPRAAVRGWWPALALGALWLPLLARWSRAWAAAPDQAYGWAVPALALYLIWERSRDRPAALAPGPGGRAIAWFAAGAGLLALLAVLPVLEANPLWPAAQWAAAAAAALATLGGLALAGGGAWAVHFAFPIGFMATALTWPTAVNGWITAELGGLNARLAAEIVSTLGYPAVVNGNVIAVGNGSVGVDEACSGLRSLQAVGMMGLFFGEFFRMGVLRRGGLVALALAVALAGNLARTSFLTWQAAARGIEASEHWHDPAGTAELVLTLAAVGVVAVWAGLKPPPSGAAAPGSRSPGGPAFSAAWCAAVLLAAALAEGGTQAWYRWHERRMPAPSVHWALVAPKSDWHPVDLPPRVREMLHYSEGRGLAWQDPRTRLQGEAFVVSWDGDPAYGEGVDWHDPTICLPAAGAKLAADLGEIPLSIRGQAVAFAGYRFELADGPHYVFFCHWEEGTPRPRGEAAAPAYDVREHRLQRVRAGRRRADLAHLALEVQAPDDATALAWAREWAPQVLDPTPRS